MKKEKLASLILNRRNLDQLRPVICYTQDVPLKGQVTFFESLLEVCMGKYACLFKVCVEMTVCLLENVNLDVSVFEVYVEVFVFLFDV